MSGHKKRWSYPIDIDQPEENERQIGRQVDCEKCGEGYLSKDTYPRKMSHVEREDIIRRHTEEAAKKLDESQCDGGVFRLSRGRSC